MKRSDVLERLNAAVLSLTSSDAWQSWLMTRKRFHRYSFRNQVLISVQTPMVEDPPKSGNFRATAECATIVAGYRRWRELGYQVVKGAVGIGILAPHKPSQKAIREAKANGDDEPKVRFGGANVFDVSQTVPIPGEAQPLEAPGVWGEAVGPDDPDLAADIARAAVEQLGVDYVDFCGQPDGGKGVYIRSRKRIELDADLGGAECVEVLVHELAHHVDCTLEGRIEQYDIGELVAESAAFMVCDGLGIDTSGVSSFYVAHWTKNIEDPAAALSAVAGRVLDVTKAIEDALAHVRPGPDDSDAGAAAAAEPAAVAA